VNRIISQLFMILKLNTLTIFIETFKSLKIPATVQESLIRFLYPKRTTVTISLQSLKLKIIHLNIERGRNQSPPDLLSAFIFFLKKN
jgi:hypothetical protein